MLRTAYCPDQFKHRIALLDASGQLLHPNPTSATPTKGRATPTSNSATPSHCSPTSNNATPKYAIIVIVIILILTTTTAPTDIELAPAPVRAAGPFQWATVAGPLCFSGDVLAQRLYLPTV